jgi:exopolyphosphatase/pppGpp-phosphohydrolase
METMGHEECLVSDLGLREGVLIDLARADQKSRPFIICI